MATKYCGKDFLVQIATLLTAWATTIPYKVGDYVSSGGSNYVCAIAHTSGTFATDLTAVRWVLQATQPYQTVGGLQSNSISINNETVDVTDKGDMPWRELINCGVRSMDVSGNGHFTDENTLKRVMDITMSGVITLFKLTSGRGDSFVGLFQSSKLERSGDHNNAETYTFALASSNAVTFTAGP